MLRKPISTLVASLALVLAVVIFTAPYAAVAEAAQPSTCVLFDGGGSARFSPNELPSTITRDSDSGCHVMSFELVNGRYTRKIHPCKYGNVTAKKTYNHRQMYSIASAAEPAADSASQMVESTQPAGAAAQDDAQDVGAETDAVSDDAEVEVTAMPEEGESTQVVTDDVVTDTVESTADAQPAVEQVEADDQTSPEDELGDIVETAAEDMNFAMLLAAAGATDLSGTLRDIGPYTVFAPNDDAFAAALPGGDLDELLIEAGDQLAQIVLYHLVQGAYPSDVLTNGMQLETLHGGILTVTVDGDAFMINDVNVVTSDMEASNGVIHVIDGVLQPPSQ